jgi:hypothetical protein
MTQLQPSYGQPIRRVSGYFSGLPRPPSAPASSRCAVSRYSHHPQRGVCGICWNPQRSCSISSTSLLHTLRNSIRILSGYYPDTGYIRKLSGYYRDSNRHMQQTHAIDITAAFLPTQEPSVQYAEHKQAGDTCRHAPHLAQT